MLTETDVTRAIGATAYDRDGKKLGKVGHVFLDDHTGAPEFLTVNTGLFGTSESFVPTDGASLDGDRVRVAFDEATIKDAPSIDGDHLEPDEEQRLFAHYGIQDGVGAVQPSQGQSETLDSTDAPTGEMATQPDGHDTSGPSTDDAMTRSEEHLVAGTETRESGRARLRKYVTTEQETVTVPVRKERVVLETEPVTAGTLDEAGAGPEISEEEHEVVLHEERAVVDTVVEPVERVRVGTETVVEQETVSGDVRTEHIELEDDADQAIDASGTPRR